MFVLLQKHPPHQVLKCRLVIPLLIVQLPFNVVRYTPALPCDKQRPTYPLRLIENHASRTLLVGIPVRDQLVSVRLKKQKFGIWECALVLYAGPVGPYESMVHM